MSDPSRNQTIPVAPRESMGSPLPKLVGGDFELGNFIVGLSRAGGTGYEASQLLLHEIAGVSADDGAAEPCDLPQRAPPSSGDSPPGENGSPEFTSQDFGRKYLANGGCAYIDLWHLEMCLPEVRSASAHVAYTHALYRLAWRAAASVNQQLPAGRKLFVLANNSDGLGNSYGSHLNVLINGPTWEKICHRRLLHQGFLAAYQVSSIVFAGLGKVGAENDAPEAAFQISQRADFIERLCSSDTTFRRPIVNTRNEALCGSGSRAATGEMARMHVITYDHNLNHVAGFLKIGVLQIILAMLEVDWVNADLVLEDPVHAMTRWSHDPLLQERVPLWSGANTSAVELQIQFFAEAQRFVSSGACSDRVPDVDEILGLWGDTLEKLQARNFPALSRRLDWVLKFLLLTQALRNRPDLTWTSPAIKHLDQLYSSLDPGEGLYWPLERRGLIETVASEEQIERSMVEAPANTRAWTRAHLLNLARPGDVEQIDWDFIRFTLADATRPGWRRRFRADLSNPLQGKAETAPGVEPASRLEDALLALGSEESPEPQQFKSMAGNPRPPNLGIPCRPHSHPRRRGSISARPTIVRQPQK